MSTDDSPEREFDVYDREGFPRATLEDLESTSNVSEREDMSNPSTEKPKSCRTPRREVWWLDLGTKNQSLESIKGRFEDCLDRFLSSSSNSLLRHITSPMDNKLRHNLHQCPGYLREEITLAPDVSKSVIISHAFPSQSEVCSICGQLVQYKFTEPSVVDGSHNFPHLQPSHSPIAGPSSPALSDSESIRILFPSPTLSSHSSRRFMTTSQLRDNRPEEKSGLSSLRLLNPETFTRHRRESLDTDTDSSFSVRTPAFPTISNRSVHFLTDTHELHDNKPEERYGLSSQSLFNPDRFRRRKLSDIDSGSGWIPRSPTLSCYSSRNHSNKSEENLSRFHRNGSSNSVIRTDDLDDFSHTNILVNSPGGRRPLSGFFSSLKTMLSRKSSGVRRDRSRQKFGSIG